VESTVVGKNAADFDYTVGENTADQCDQKFCEKKRPIFCQKFAQNWSLSKKELFLQEISGQNL
jgi:hypothetical protein